MMQTGVIEWLDEHLGGNAVLYLKRLSANDTLASGGHRQVHTFPGSSCFVYSPR